MDASICFFGTYDAEAQRVDVVWQLQDGVELQGGSFPLGSGLTSQVIRERQARLVTDWLHQGPHVQVQYATERPDLPQSAITVPALLDSRVLGVLSVQAYPPAAFDQTHLATVQRLVDRASPRIAALLERERQDADGVLLAADWHRLTTTSDDAMLALDSDRRMLSMNGAARALLSLPGQSFVFGHPVDQPQAHLWPLGSATLSHAVRPLLDRLARGEAPLEIEIALGEATRGVVTCAASEVGAGDYPRGTVLTLACHQSTGGLADPGGNA